ncbi:MAG TPA: asparagine synthetase B, partial [Planctomycetota bacterium]|nr:asparagine synthetase B [Planctomycetota bacterium]
MCGILGVYLRGKPASAADVQRYKSVLAHLAHRGPDGSGDVVAGPMWMGHRRLSIYDLSDSGTQPFSDAASGWHVAINGTHHGAAHVRKQLLSQGIHLRSGSDCELLLPLLQRDGPAAIDSFQGPFAIAAFHEASRTLWLARDAAGEKPLYYALTEDALIFASELKPLRMLLQAPKVDAEAASTFLRLGWLPAPHTILAGVLQVPPGVRIA